MSLIARSSGLSVGSSGFHGILGWSHAARERFKKAHSVQPQAAFHAEIHGAQNLHAPGPLFPALSPRSADGWSLGRDGPSWRRSASRSEPEPSGETAALRRQMITLRMRSGASSAPGPQAKTNNNKLVPFT